MAGTVNCPVANGGSVTGSWWVGVIQHQLQRPPVTWEGNVDARRGGASWPCFSRPHTRFDGPDRNSSVSNDKKERV